MWGVGCEGYCGWGAVCGVGTVGGVSSTTTFCE